MHPAVVAHRGSSQARPEHTLDAYALAIEEGADGLECDVRVTRDGHLVCVHDRRVDRTSTGRGIVSGLSLPELSRLDYGRWHDPPAATADDLIRQRVAVPQTGPLLTLHALLGLVVDAGRPVRLFVETKHPVRYAGLVEAKLVAALARFGLARPASREESAVVAMSFSAMAMRRLRTDAPRLPTVLLLERLSAPLRSGWLPPWVDATGPGVHLVRADSGYVARAAERGHPTYCWTVDDPADARLCASLGVRWLATNTPTTIRRTLGH